MKTRRAKVVVSGVVMLVIASGAYFYRLPIKTWLWHVRHGNTTMVGSYVVPVPANWYVEDIGGGTQLLFRLDTSDHSPRKRIKVHSGIFVSIFPRAMTNQFLAFLLSREKEDMERKGIHPMERTLNLEGESLPCIGVPLPQTPEASFNIEPFSWTCKSPGGLEVTIQSSEPDFDEAWEIVSHIRRKS